MLVSRPSERFTNVDVYDSSLTKSTATNLSAGRIYTEAGIIGDYALFPGGNGHAGFFRLGGDIQLIPYEG